LCGTHYAYRRRHGTLPPLIWADGCSVDGCERKHEAKGYCKTHYQRLRATGSLVEPIMAAPDDVRFWSKVRKTETCWLWAGGISTTGYGHVWWDGKTELAHRIAYQLLVGPIPRELTIDHLRELCGNRPCVKAVADEFGPAHLELVTLRVNNLRSDSAGGKNARKTHCKHGHEFTLENTYVPPKKPTSRYCRKCMAVTDRAAQAKRRASREARALDF
jgi:hypothetical protein